MKKYTIKVPAKINLTLDVLGAENGYHQIDSLVASISVYDTITVKKRTDGKITITNKGLPIDCPIIENNAYQAGKLFIDTFGTPGVDIIIDDYMKISGDSVGAGEIRINSIDDFAVSINGSYDTILMVNEL